MEQLSRKVRISSLWLMQMIAFFAYRTLAVSEKASEVSLLSNSDFANYLLIMMLFAFLSLTLKDRWIRSTNVIAGSIFGVLQLIMLIDGAVGYGITPFNLMTAVTVAIMASVVWFAYALPARPASL